MTPRQLLHALLRLASQGVQRLSQAASPRDLPPHGLVLVPVPVQQRRRADSPHRRDRC